MRTDVVKLKDAYERIKQTDTFADFDWIEKRKYNYKFFGEFVEKHRTFRGDYHERIKIGSTQYKTVLVGYALIPEEEHDDEIGG